MKKKKGKVGEKIKKCKKEEKVKKKQKRNALWIPL